MEPPVAGPATVGRQAAEAEIAGSGEAVRAGSRDPALPPPSSLPDGPACGRTPPIVKTRELGDGHEAHASRHRQKVRAHGARTA